jgi:AcrR family transcriptional regulator
VAADSVPARKLRADAERNRRALLDAARATFNAQGISASLEDIARSSGVGIGTLYRHFPTRDALIAEVYRNEVEKLAEAARALSPGKAPMEALREWLLLFVDYFTTKLILADAIKSMVAVTAGTGDVLTKAVTDLIDRAIESGDIAPGSVDPMDLLRAISGVATAGALPGWEQGARRMVEVLINGLSVKPQRSTGIGVRESWRRVSPPPRGRRR